MPKYSLKYYLEIKNKENAFFVKNLKNPIKINEDITILYCYGKGKIYECLIDTEDIEKISINRAWGAAIRKNTKHVRIGIGEARGLEHYILNKKAYDGFVIDHKNGNTLDNRKENLRIVKQGINMLNKKRYKNTKLEKNISKINNKYNLSFSRLFYDYEIAKKAQNEILKILNKYSNEDIEKNRMDI